MGFFEDLGKGKVTKALDTVGNGALKIAGNVTKKAGNVADNTLGALMSPIQGVGSFLSSPFTPILMLVGGGVALYVITRR